MNFNEIFEIVWTEIGPGFSESIYHNAIEVELRHRGVDYETEKIIPVEYKSQCVGHIRADLVVERKTIIEIKSVRSLKDDHRQQLRNYMKTLDIDHAILVNFPPSEGQVEVEYFAF